MLVLKKNFMSVFLILYFLNLVYIYALYNDIPDIKSNGLGYTILLFAEFSLLCIGFLISLMVLSLSGAKIKFALYFIINLMSDISLIYMGVNFVFLILIIGIQIFLFIIWQQSLILSAL